MISVGFISLGCAKNLVDTQVMAGVLLSEGIQLAPSPEAGDVLIVNTCAFVEDARTESLAAIRDACSVKNAGRCPRAVLVAGCLPQRYREELRKDLPEVDAFIGLDELDQVGRIVRRLAAGNRDIFEISRESKRLFEPHVAGLSLTGGPYAYLKIAEGCNHRCAFCAIPAIRGRYRSRAVAQIVNEAEQLLANGIVELNLVSQDTTVYGTDTAGESDLVSLLRALAGIGDGFWVRLLYGYPSHVTDQLLSSMAETPQVCHYLDLPIQHSDPEILRAMQRGDTVEHVSGIAARARQMMPDIVLRTTCLVGFPGEEEAHFERLLAFVREMEFDHLGVFVFSPEANTKAFSMAGRPAVEIAEERRARLMIAQKEIVDRKAGSLVGRRTEVLLERSARDSDSTWIGRSRRDAPEVDGEIHVDGVPSDMAPGTIIVARYTEQSDYDMKATYMSL